MLLSLLFDLIDDIKKDVKKSRARPRESLRQRLPPVPITSFEERLREIDWFQFEKLISLLCLSNV